MESAQVSILDPSQISKSWPKQLNNRLKNRPMEDIVIGLLLVLDFQLYVMAMRARSNEELIRLVIIDLFIWAVALANQ